MSDDQKTPEPGAWGAMGGGPPMQPKFMTEQVAHLEKLRDLLTGVLGQKQAEIRAMQEKLLRLKHGGGQ